MIKKLHIAEPVLVKNALVRVSGLKESASKTQTEHADSARSAKTTAEQKAIELARPPLELSGIGESFSRLTLQRRELSTLSTRAACPKRTSQRSCKSEEANQKTCPPHGHSSPSLCYSGFTASSGSYTAQQFGSFLGQQLGLPQDGNGGTGGEGDGDGDDFDHLSEQAITLGADKMFDCPLRKSNPEENRCTQAGFKDASRAK